MRLLEYYVVCILVAIGLMQVVACGNRMTDDEKSYRLPDTLRVGTLYSPTSLFIFRGDTMGYEYERISNFAKDKKLKLEFVVARNMESMIELLDSGEIDIIARKDGIIAFVEVKTRDISAFESGVQAVGRRKRSLIINAAQEYSRRYPHELQPRFDISEVTVKNGKIVKFSYLDNAYDGGEDSTL